jgi:hypothetical protein
MSGTAASAGLWPWLTVGMMGLLVGIGELTSRYRDAPMTSIRSWPGLAYLAVNAAVSVWAFSLAQMFGWTVGVDASADPDKVAMAQVFAAGFGAMALLRSAIFTVRVSGTDVAVGPAQVIQVLFTAIDNEVDRLGAQRRADEITAIMSGVDFDKAAQALPDFCFALMQEVDADDRSAITQQVKDLSAAAMPKTVKTLTLGLALMNVVGSNTLREAVRTLGVEIRETPVQPPVTASLEPQPVAIPQPA